MDALNAAPPGGQRAMARLSQRSRGLLKLAFGLALVALLLWRFDFRQVLAAFARFDAGSVIAALTLYMLSWPIAAARWWLFAPRFTLRRLLELTLIGQLYTIVLPGQLAGEAVKAYRAARGNADAERLAASVLLDRLIGTISMLLVAGIGAMFASLPALRFVLFGFALVLTGFLFALEIPAVYRLADTAIDRLGVSTRLRRFAPNLKRLLTAWRDFARAPWRLLASLAVGMVLQGIAIAMYALLARDLGIAVAPADWAWIVAVTSLAVLLPLSVGGIGLREGSLVGCLGYLGIGGAPAVALSLGLFAITLSGALAGALVELAPRRSS